MDNLLIVKSKLKTYTLAKALHNKHNNKIYAHATNQKKGLATNAKPFIICNV